MYKLNAITELIELGNYLKNSFKFVLIDSDYKEESIIHWNIQYINFGLLNRKNKNRDLRIFLEIVVVQNSLEFDNNNAELIITNLQTKFEISEESYSILQNDIGEVFVMTTMQDAFKRRYELVCSKNIPSKFKDFKVTISIESFLRDILPDAKLILTDEDLKKSETKIVEELTEQNKHLTSFIEEVRKNTRPLIITEGKTDIQHIRNAKEKLMLQNIDVDFFEIKEDWGDSKLKSLLEQLSKVMQPRIIIGVFDRDDETIVNDIEKNEQSFKDYGNNIFGFCIPLENESIYGKLISIEHYYPKNILLKQDENNRRLFLGNEFYESGNSRDGKYQTKTSKIQHKVKVNGIIDEKVFMSDDLEQKESIALTKANFVNLIETSSDFLGDFDFKSFNSLFNQRFSV